MPEQKQRNPKKICLVTFSLSQGGAERSTALLSQVLSQEGFDVSIVTLNDAVDYPYAGRLFSLNRHFNKKENTVSRFIRFKRLLSTQQFDYIIDNRTRISNFKEFLYLNFLYRNKKVVYMVRSYKINSYFPPSDYLAKKMIAKSYAVIGVSKAISEQINSVYQTEKSRFIYNPIAVPVETSKSNIPKGGYILFLGRIEEKVKNLSLLLEAYRQSSLRDKDIQLLILGDGPDKAWLHQHIDDLNLKENVSCLPYTPDVASYLKNALFQVLTSRYEGFPRVLIESLSVGTPVISVDCNSGPREIIKNRYNGLLVENHNPAALSEAFDSLVDDTQLYENCKNNAVTSIAHLQFDRIAKKWQQLLQ